MKNQYKMRVVVSLLAGFTLTVVGACADEEPAGGEATEVQVTEVQVTADTFECLADMTPVRHFFVDNLLGDLAGTLAIANSENGGKYPPGSVVQLVPTEVMVKHGAGWNLATRDWEFFELDVSVEGSSIRNRGFVDVVNQFGGNCFGCHIKARPEWDLICEKDHGCDSIPVTAEQILQLQQADPRCKQDESMDDRNE